MLDSMIALAVLGCIRILPPLLRGGSEVGRGRGAIVPCAMNSTKCTRLYSQFSGVLWCEPSRVLSIRGFRARVKCLLDLWHDLLLFSIQRTHQILQEFGKGTSPSAPGLPRTPSVRDLTSRLTTRTNAVGHERS